MRQLSICNKDSGVSNAFTHRKIPLLYNSAEPRSKGAPFSPFPLGCPKFATLCLGGSGPQVCRLPKTDQSDEETAADEGGPNLQDSSSSESFPFCSLVLEKTICTFLSPKGHLFFSFASVIPLPRPLLSGIPKMKNWP